MPVRPSHTCTAPHDRSSRPPSPGCPQGLVPILTTAVTAHVLCLGIGLPQWLVAKAKGRAGAAAA